MTPEMARRITSRQEIERHVCHWPACGKPVPPALWGCKEHWFKLPRGLRLLIWDTYVPGQEITKTPSAAYLDAARKAQEWIHQSTERS